MKLLGKMITLALLVAMVSPLALGYVRSQAQAPASCHERGPKAPVPSPVSYQCCRAGHQFAAVREAVDFRAPFMPLSRVVELAVIPSGESNRAGQSNFRMLAYSPPRVTSLRI